MKYSLRIASASLAAIIVMTPIAAQAIRLKDEVSRATTARMNTKKHLETQNQENMEIRAAVMDFLKEQGPPPVNPVGPRYIGEITIGGSAFVANFAAGTTETLTFQFIDASTMLPVTTQPIGSVMYEVNTDPSTGVYSLIGTSSNAAGNFAISYTFGTNEPDFLGIPFDATGAPIFVADGVDGVGNVATAHAFNIPLPEPSSWALMMLGVGAVGWSLRRRTAAVA